MSGDISQIADRLRAVARKANNAGGAVESALRAFVNSHAGRGLDPSGKPWPPTAEGTAPLQNAAKAVRYSHTPRGAKVTVVDRNNARHHLGIANGAPRRQIIPDQLTPELSTAVEDHVRRELESDG